jgi:hypothetical protein
MADAEAALDAAEKEFNSLLGATSPTSAASGHEKEKEPQGGRHGDDEFEAETRAMLSEMADFTSPGGGGGEDDDADNENGVAGGAQKTAMERILLGTSED